MEALLGLRPLPSGKTNPSASKVDVNAKDGYGFAPLHYAALRGDINMAEAVVKKGRFNVVVNVV